MVLSLITHIVLEHTTLNLRESADYTLAKQKMVAITEYLEEAR